MSKIGIDVKSCQGQGYQMQFTNTHINPYASFNNVVGVYFEDENGDFLPEAIVIYPETKNQDLSDFYDYVPVPNNAHWMGYWLLPNGTGSWMKKPDYNRMDVLELKQRDDGFVSLYFTEEKLSRDYPQELHRFKKGDRCPTNGYAGQVHLSNSEHNYGGAEWFIRLEDGSVLIEDWRVGSEWDFGVWWSAPRSLVPCNCFNP